MAGTSRSPTRGSRPPRRGRSNRCRMACQSAAFGLSDADVEAAALPESEPLDDDSPLFVSPASPLDFDAAGVRVAARSFFAQPEPLKRIAGVLKPFRRVP